MMASTSSDDQPVMCLGGCGHRLTSDLAKARGYGHRCWRKLHGRTGRRHAISVRTAPAGAGQLTFDDHDPDSEWIDDLPLPPPDLWGQRATERQIWTMTDIPLTGSYL